MKKGVFSALIAALSLLALAPVAQAETICFPNGECLEGEWGPPIGDVGQHR